VFSVRDSMLTSCKLSILNIMFVTFLAVRNTPLGILIAHSYEHLTQLHAVAGYTTFIFFLLHVTLEVVGMIRLGIRYKLLETRRINGIVVLVAIFIMLIFGAFHRKLGYELFYLSHVIMYIVAFVFHLPENRPAAVIPAIVAGSIWAADRVIRLLRIVWYSYDNRATILPLPHGATRIIIKRASSTSVPGSHCYLRIPKIRLLETRPFTIVNKSKSSLEFVVSAYDGFTRDLHAHVMRYPGTSLQASFDGPYGSILAYSKTVDKAIFIAGGSGASFTFGVALEMINLEQPTVEFIWALREKGEIRYTCSNLIRWLIIHRVFPGRPDIESMIRNIVARSNDKENILIVCCGSD
jgi:predicted ferric reductase